jgi:DNA-binding transcriptional LysR family regulator
MSGSNQPPNLKLLHVFNAVARHLSFTRAAAELQRSQATLSVQLRELERQLHVPLLVRTTRRVALTEAGVKLAAAVAEGFAAIEAGVSEVQKLGEARRNRVILACAPSLSSSRLPAILARYRELDQETRIDVEELTSNEIFAALRNRTVEFGVGPCPSPPPPEISFNAAVEDPLYVLLSSGEEVWSETGIPFDNLAELRLITLSGSVLLQQMLETIAEERGWQLRTGTEVRHMQTAIAMAQAGVGAAVVPRLALPDHIDSGVAVLPIVHPSISRQVGIITLAGVPLEPSATRIARYIRSGLALLANASLPVSSPVGGAAEPPPGAPTRRRKSSKPKKT